MEGGLQPALAGAEGGAAGGADDRSALLHDAAHVVPGHAAQPVVVAIDHALVALVDGEDCHAVAERGAHHRPQRGVHARRVAAAGQHTNCTNRIICHRNHSCELMIVSCVPAPFYDIPCRHYLARNTRQTVMVRPDTHLTAPSLLPKLFDFPGDCEALLSPPAPGGAVTTSP